MTRNKVELAYISGDSERKATYNKRKKGIMKKLTELTILCGIRACAIVPNPFKSQSEVFPNTQTAMDLVEKYQNTPEKDESKNFNQVSFIMNSISKAQEFLNKGRNHKDDELTLVMYNYMDDETLPEDLSYEDCYILNELAKNKMKEIDLKIAMLSQ